MKQQEEKNLSFSHRMFLAYARTHSLPHARELALSYCTPVEVAICERLHDHFASVIKWSWTEIIQYVKTSRSPLPTVEMSVLWFLLEQSELADPEPVAALRECLEKIPGRRMTNHFFAFYDGLRANRDYDFARSLYIHGQAIGRFEAWDGEPVQDYFRARCCLSATNLARQLGSPLLGRQLLGQAMELSERWELVQRVYCSTGAGFLFDSEQDFARALSCHRNAKARTIARNYGLTNWLLFSHNAAAKNALMLGRINVAASELDQGGAIIRSGASHRLWDQGYTVLLGADVKWRRGRREEALSAVQVAYKFFDELKPSYNPGKFDTVLTRARFLAQALDLDALSETIDKIEELAPAQLSILRSRDLRQVIASLRSLGGEQATALQARIESLMHENGTRVRLASDLIQQE